MIDLKIQLGGTSQVPLTGAFHSRYVGGVPARD